MDYANNYEILFIVFLIFFCTDSWIKIPECNLILLLEDKHPTGVRFVSFGWRMQRRFTLIPKIGKYGNKIENSR